MQTAVGAFGGEGCIDVNDMVMVENAGNSNRPAISSLNCPPFIAVELCREHLIENDGDVLWTSDTREKNEDVAARGVKFMKWLLTREEKEIAVVTHSGFLRKKWEEMSKHFNNCELRSMAIVDRSMIGSNISKTDFPGKIPYGGRHSLVKSVLGSLGLYWFSIFPVPKKVIDSLESIRRNFFWGGLKDEKVISWVNWNDACDKKENGGLDIGSLKSINEALIAKWVWRSKVDGNSLWVKVIQSIHGIKCLMEEGKWSKASGSVWRNIVKKVLSVNPPHLVLSNIMQVQIGDGAGTEFWNDLWIGDIILSRRFPRLFALESNKFAKVKDRCALMDGVWDWRRPIRGGREDEERANLIALIRPISLVNRSDTWKLNGAPEGVFTVKWYREELRNARQPIINPGFKWLKWIPKKINIFIWRLLKYRIPVRKVIADMGIDIDSILCPICNVDIETVDHAFLSCGFASDVWRSFCNWWQLSLPFAGAVVDIGGRVDSIFSNSRRHKSLWVSVVAILKALWDHRNGVIYRSKRGTSELVFSKAKELSSFWLENRCAKWKIDRLKWRISPMEAL